MRALHLPVLTILILALAACSSVSLEGKRVDYKSKASTVKMPALEVPPDLTAPGGENRYTIPDSGGEAAASYSDFAKSGATAPAKAAIAVLPEVKNVRLEHSGAQHWLVVEDKAENVWPLIKGFWLENGFVLKTDNPQAGVIETEWAENRAKIPQGGLRNVIGKVFSNAYSSGERDMYLTRLERSKDGNSMEIHVTQYGKEEVLTADKTTFKWQSRPNDPELETVMLQMLMVKLGGGTEAKVQDASADATAVAAPKLQTLANGSNVILLSEPFDKSWRKVGLALERAKLAVEDKDRANGVYFVRAADPVVEKSWLAKLAFWRKEGSAKPAQSPAEESAQNPLGEAAQKSAGAGRYQVTVHEGSAGCEVVASSAKGESNATSQRIIDTLYKAISASK